MKQLAIIFLSLFYLSMNTINGQEVITLPVVTDLPEGRWAPNELNFHSKVWDTEVVTNVSTPTLTVFRPSKENNSGTAVVICPGGGMYAHSIQSEGYQVAEWLAKKGVTAFVLKYRLVPTADDATSEFQADGAKVHGKAKEILPLAIEDGLHAIKYIRSNTAKYGIKTHQVGIMGFSAGGAVTMGVTYTADEQARPNFIAPVYPWMIVVDPTPMPKDAGPIFVACATDDPLDLAPASVVLYQEWAAAGKQAALHMYAKGGHGFGMRVKNLPSDHWIEHFGQWLKGQELIK